MSNRHRYWLLLALFMGGCTSSQNISKVYPFSSYVGRTVTIQRPIAVVQTWNIWSGPRGPGGIPTLSSSASRALKNTNDVETGEMVYTVLPMGHPVYLESVRDEIAFDSESIVTYGRTTIPPGEKPVQVAYRWGMLWCLEPAPWEPDTLPKRRYLPD